MNKQDFDTVLKKRHEELESFLKACEPRLETAPEGSLRISHSKGYPQFYLYTGQGKKLSYIKKSELPRRLAQKTYDQSVVKLAKTELASLNKLIDKRKAGTAESVYDLMNSDRQKLISPVRISDTEFARKWMDVKYEGKGFSKDMPIYITDRDEKVRSKSEVLIANLLARKNVPYRYEFPLTIPGVGVFYPDFLVLNVRKRREFIHEHFGMMDNPEYADNAVRKLSTYEQAGFFPGEKLIVTCGTRRHPLNIQNLNLLIDKYYL